MKIDTNKRKEGGFTIVELLTVMGIIAILIGLLVPALGMVKDYAKQVQQGAQFHSIEVGLDLYKAEFGSYPPSNDNAQLPVHPRSNVPYSGANKLAEAMVGLDFLGFHPNSDFRADGLSDIIDKQGVQHPNVQIYNARQGIPLGNPVYQTPEENVKCRGGKAGAPFVELENANAFRMDDVYVPAQLGNFLPGSMILCDVYAKKRNTASAQKTGMPVLYYRARTQFTEQDSTTLRPGVQQYYNPQPGIDDDIYYYPDNLNLLLLQTPESTPQDHPLADNAGNATDVDDFENMIINRQVTRDPRIDIKRPFRAQTYILISAGKDGLYGTADDITNFSKKE
jgi:type II secretory pathway pseudopilin PulG